MANILPYILLKNNMKLSGSSLHILLTFMFLTSPSQYLGNHAQKRNSAHALIFLRKLDEGLIMKKKRNAFCLTFETDTTSSYLRKWLG